MLTIDDNILIAIAVGGFFLFAFVYIVYKDSVVNRKLRSYEFALEELNRQIFVLEKNQKKLLAEAMNSSKEESFQFTKELLQKEVSGYAQNLISSVNEIQHNQDYMQQEIYSRIENLENKFNEFISVPDKSVLDETRVMSLYNAGYTPEGISRELHANLSEVNFILNLYKNSNR